MDKEIKILLASKDEEYTENFITASEKQLDSNLSVSISENVEDICAKITEPHDVLLLDVEFLHKRGLFLIKILLSYVNDIPIIILTDHENIELAASAMRYGAQDYLLKDQFNLHVTSMIIRYTIESKRTEKFNREQLHFLQSIMDHIPSPLYLKDKDLTFTACNFAFENMMGISKNEIMGNTVFEIFDKKSAEMIREKELQLISGSNTQIYELDFTSPNDNLCHMVFHETVHKRANGSLAGLIGIGSDITKITDQLTLLNNEKKCLENEITTRSDMLSMANSQLQKQIIKRKNAEKNLKRERNLFLRGPVTVFRCRASQKRQIEYISSNIAQYGYKPEHFTNGKIQILDIIQPEYRNKLLSLIQENSINNNSHFAIELNILPRNSDSPIKITAYINIIRGKKGIPIHYDGYFLNPIFN